MNKNFPEKPVQMAHHTTRYSVSSANKETQTRMALRGHDAPTGTAGTVVTPSAAVGAHKPGLRTLLAALPLKTKLTVTRLPSGDALSIQPGEMKAYAHTTQTPTFTAALSVRATWGAVLPDAHGQTAAVCPPHHGKAPRRKRVSEPLVTLPHPPPPGSWADLQGITPSAKTQPEQVPHCVIACP